MELMLAYLTLFELFRWFLAVVCTVYATVLTIQWLWGWLKYFGTSRQTAILGRYATLLLVRIRLRRFALELVQIVALTVLFFYIVHWNHLLIQAKR